MRKASTLSQGHKRELPPLKVIPNQQSFGLLVDAEEERRYLATVPWFQSDWHIATTTVAMGRWKCEDPGQEGHVESVGFEWLPTPGRLPHGSGGEIKLTRLFTGVIALPSERGTLLMQSHRGRKKWCCWNKVQRSCAPDHDPWFCLRVAVGVCFGLLLWNALKAMVRVIQNFNGKCSNQDIFKPEFVAWLPSSPRAVLVCHLSNPWPRDLWRNFPLNSEILNQQTHWSSITEASLRSHCCSKWTQVRTNNLLLKLTGGDGCGRGNRLVWNYRHQDSRKTQRRGPLCVELV